MLKILIPVDGSSCALEGVKYVIQESRQHTEPMHVHLVNVQPRLPKDVTRYARHEDVHAYQAECAGKALAAAVALLGGASLPHSVHISKGDVIDSIVACAATLHCDRIVMGTARKNALVRFIEGSVINRVIARSDIPVEVIARKQGTLLERFAVPVGFGAGLMLLWAAISEQGRRSQLKQGLVLHPSDLKQVQLARTKHDLDGVEMGEVAAYDPSSIYHGLLVGSLSEATFLVHRMMTANLLRKGLMMAMLDGKTLGGPIAGRPW